MYLEIFSYFFKGAQLFSGSKELASLIVKSCKIWKIIGATLKEKYLLHLRVAPSEKYLSEFPLTNLYTFLANSADDKLIFFLIFPQETGFAFLCKLSPVKCQILFSGEKTNKIEYFNTKPAGNFTQSAKR